MIPFRSVLDNVEEVVAWLDEVEPKSTDKEFDVIRNHIRTQLLFDFSYKFHDNNYLGALDGATGMGKSRIGVFESKIIVQNRPNATIILVVPTEQLRDNTWKNEFTKWDAPDIYDNNVIRVCYASLNKLRGVHASLIIFDEYHHITDFNAEFFKHNTWHGILCLSATKPTEQSKLAILERIKVKTIVSIPVQLAVRLRLISPYKIVVVETSLERNRKSILVGKEGQQFKITEKQDYEYRDAKLRKLLFSKAKDDRKKYEFYTRQRMQLIYNLGSKKQIAQYLLEHFIPQDEKFLIFAGSIEQANELYPHRFHSKNKRYNQKSLGLFESGQIKRLACINSLNEGVHVGGIDGSLAVQINSNDRDFVQRLGRNVAYRRNHTGVMIILCCVDTQDKEWTKNALENFEETEIIRTTYSHILVGNFKYTDIK